MREPFIHRLLIQPETGRKEDFQVDGNPVSVAFCIGVLKSPKLFGYVIVWLKNQRSSGARRKQSTVETFSKKAVALYNIALFPRSVAFLSWCLREKARALHRNFR